MLQTRRPPDLRPAAGSARPLWLAAIALLVFLATAAAVASGLTHGFDEAVLLALRNPADLAQPLGPGWLQETGRDVTGLGSNGVAGALVLAAAAVLALAGQRRSSLFLAAIFVGALLLQGGVKALVARPRPALVPQAARVFTTSFPSSHATVAAALAVAIAVLLARAPGGRRMHGAAAVLAAGFAAAVGLSRLYLGVHWPTDVLAGWSLGAAWAALCWAVLNRSRQHRA